MNSRHAEILLKLLRTFESINEIESVGVNFTDSVGREFLHCKAELEFEIACKKPKKTKGD